MAGINPEDDQADAGYKQYRAGVRGGWTEAYAFLEYQSVKSWESGNEQKAKDYRDMANLVKVHISNV